MRILVNLFALLLLATSCNSKKATQNKSIKKAEPLSGTYYIFQIGTNTSIPGKLTITLEDSTNNVSGFAGCNIFFGTYSLDNRKLTLENLALSKKYCQKEVNSLERELITALNNVNSFSLDENEISFLKDETVLLKANKSDSVEDK